MMRPSASLLVLPRRPAAQSLLAATAGMLVMLGGRLLFGVPTPAELFGDRLTTLIPLPVFAGLLGFFGGDAKHWYFAALVVGQGLLTAIAGLAYQYLRRWSLARLRSGGQGSGSAPRLSYQDVPILVVWLWLLSPGLLAPVIGGGLLGARLAGGIATTFTAQLLPDATYAILALALARFSAATPRPIPAQPAEAFARRRVLQQAGLALVVLAGGAGIWELVAHAFGLARPAQPGAAGVPAAPSGGAFTAVPGQAPEVTSAAAFYYVSKNLFGDPALDQQTWRLSITGLVDRPYTLSYNELRALPAIARFHTLECISNEVGGDLISNANFTGVSLASVLARAGIQSGANAVIFRAADDYSDMLHLTQALDQRTLIAYLINGAPLPQAHGFPARLLIPGLYGMKNGKWLTELEVSASPFTGYWELRGWTNEPDVKLMARIDVPHDGDLLPARPTAIAGVAYSGDRGIARVEVSTDGGQTWRAATLKQPLDALTWVLWEFAWTPTPGAHAVLARATDLAGNVQTAVVEPTLPDGASGYHRITVTVA